MKHTGQDRTLNLRPRLGDSLKELEEAAYWLELSVESGAVSQKKLASLIDETSQLTAILTSIAKKFRAWL